MKGREGGDKSRVRASGNEAMGPCFVESFQDGDRIDALSAVKGI
jgi:hypothetical protein